MLVLLHRRAGRLQLQQTNVFHIGGADPQATANAVSGKLGTANSNLTRNLAGAIQ